MLQRISKPYLIVAYVSMDGSRINHVLIKVLKYLHYRKQANCIVTIPKSLNSY
jgi:hypothetical protein